MPIHIRAKKESVAPYVLLPGDPERTEYIANKYLTNPKLYTSYRKMFGFTGKYKDIPISIQTSGMGTPSASIIISELYNQLGVKAITRIGTMGGLSKKLNLADLVIVQSAWCSREIVSQITQCNDYVPTASWELLNPTIEIVKKQKSTKYLVGSIASTNLFYNPDTNFNKKLSSLGCLGCEMEAAALFALASVHNRHASCLLTVSDLIYGTPSDFIRANDAKIAEGVDNMVTIALEAFVNYDKEINS